MVDPSSEPIDPVRAGDVEAWDDAADVVVVGLGVRGTCAAIEAAEDGADVLALERSSAGGGTSLEVGTPRRPHFKIGAKDLEDTLAWQHEHPRLVEYQVKRALPGPYSPSLIRWADHGGPVTLRIDAYLRWGGNLEEHRKTTILMDQIRLDLPAILFGWGNAN